MEPVVIALKRSANMEENSVTYLGKRVLQKMFRIYIQ